MWPVKVLKLLHFRNLSCSILNLLLVKEADVLGLFRQLWMLILNTTQVSTVFRSFKIVLQVSTALVIGVLGCRPVISPKVILKVQVILWIVPEIFCPATLKHAFFGFQNGWRKQLLFLARLHTILSIWHKLGLLPQALATATASTVTTHCCRVGQQRVLIVS